MEDTQTKSDKQPVSRSRRALFCFGAVSVCLIAMIALAFWGPNTAIAVTVVKGLGALAMAVGLSYIGGSVIDYSKIMDIFKK